MNPIKHSLFEKPVSLKNRGHATIGPNWSRKHFIAPHHRIYLIIDGYGELIFPNKTLSLTPGNLYLIQTH